MRKIMFVLFILAFGLSMTNQVSATAVEEPDSPFVTTVTAEFVSKYIGDSGLNYGDDPVFQPGLTLEHDSGLFADIWSSIGTEGSDGDEVDFTVGWAGEVGLGFLIETGVGYWDFSRVFQGQTDNAWNIYGEISYPILPAIEAFYKVDGTFMSADSSFEGGFGQWLGLRLEGESPFVADGRLSGAMSIALAYDDGLYGSLPCASAQYRLSVDYEITSGLTVGPRFGTSLPFEEEEGVREAEIFGGAGIAYTF